MAKYVHFTLTMAITGIVISWALRLPWQGYCLWGSWMALVGIVFSYLHYAMKQQ